LSLCFKECELETEMNDLADDMSFLLERMAPDAFDNLTAFSAKAKFCRIGKRPDLKRPFCGVTGVVDFCAHSHYDRNNILAGCTVVSKYNDSLLRARS
jgi:methylcytosine dioxygenase